MIFIGLPFLPQPLFRSTYYLAEFRLTRNLARLYFYKFKTSNQTTPACSTYTPLSLVQPPFLVERIPEGYKLSSYASSLQNLIWYNWVPDRIAFDAAPSNTILSTSYYTRKLLNHHHSNESLTATSSKGGFNRFWGAASEENIKVYMHSLFPPILSPIFHHQFFPSLILPLHLKCIGLMK